jgi:outer membrane protein assembly factor BamD (BamD/ComL family)
MFTIRDTAFAFCVFACSLLMGLSPPTGAQDEQYREREVLDPETDQWVAPPAAEDVAPVGALGEARRLLAEGRPGKARKLLARWTEDNPDHERYFEGLYLLGEAEFERGHYYQAYENYELVAENTAGELFYKTLRREMDVARAFLSGEKRIVWKFMRLPAYDDGIEILDRVWERVPGTRLGEEALKLKADYFFEVGDMDLAQDEYVHLAREYPHGRYVQLAMLRGAEAAAAAFPGIRFDDRALLDAQVRYRQVQTSFPPYAQRERVADRLEGIRQQRAEKDLDIARWYERTGRAGAAEFYYRLILKERPDTLAASEAQRRLRALGAEPAAEESRP